MDFKSIMGFENSVNNVENVEVEKVEKKNTVEDVLQRWSRKMNGVSLGEVREILRLSKDEESEAETYLNIVCNAFVYGYAKGHRDGYKKGFDASGKGQDE